MIEEKQTTIYELVENVMPCITAKQYSPVYLKGLQQIFNRLLVYCEGKNIEYFSTELVQRFLLDRYGIVPGTIERRYSRIHRAMDLLLDYHHFGTVMIRRRLNRTFPEAFNDDTEDYLNQMRLRGKRQNTVKSHKKVLLRFTDFLDSAGIAGYESLTLDVLNRYIKVVLCNYCNSVTMEYYSI